MHNELIALEATDLWDGTLAHAIHFDEFGNSVAAVTRAWTGFTATGLATPFTAGGWLNPNVTIALVGDPLAVNSHWAVESLTAPTLPARLYAVSPAYTVPPPGDANYDGLVDGADYVTWADHFLQTGTWFDNHLGWTTGDFNGDGIIDGADYTAWADNFAPTQLSVSAVPEPSTLALSAIGALALLVCRLRRRFAA